MVLIDMAAETGREFKVFTLDTGRLHDETYRMMAAVRDRYGLAVEAVSPEPAEVAAMVRRYGANLFYKEVPLRMLCCEIRKARPLERRLASLQAWMTGLRRSQSESRGNIRKVDDSAAPVKVSPLADWTREQVEEYTATRNIPVHPLYAQGYTSIGCAPCTRAAGAGESERAGRWWWEQDAAKECGIHFSPDGKARRQVDVLLADLLPRGLP